MEIGHRQEFGPAVGQPLLGSGGLALAESGWDFSSRWLEDGELLGTVRTLSILPVDLNSLLVHLEQTLSEAYLLTGNDQQAAAYHRRAERRSDAIGYLMAESHKLYRCHDRLLEHKQAVFTHLTARWRDLFNVSFDVLLYDLTSTYFESDPPFPEGDKRRHGYSRDHRSDCVQVIIALVVTPEGLPLAYEVLPGNTKDDTTLKGFLDRIERQYGKARRIWLMDRGVPTGTSARKNSSSPARRALTSIVPDLTFLSVMVCILAKGSGDCASPAYHDHPT